MIVSCKLALVIFAKRQFYSKRILTQLFYSQYPPIVYDEGYSCPWPATHRFPMSKFMDLKNVLVNSRSFLGKFDVPLNPLDCPILMDLVYEVHEQSYVHKFLNDQLNSTEKRRIGLDFNEYLVRRTFLEVGGTILGVEKALDVGLAVNLAGGTHHAHYNYGSGFTVLNDMAIAARFALKNFPSKCSRVLIFDCDVHQGDGTASLLASSSNIFTVSIHCEENFPFPKAKSDMDVGLPSGVEDEDYLFAMKEAFCDALIKFGPIDLVIYDAGVDISATDILGKLKVSDNGLYRRDWWVLNECMSRRIPVCAVIGGGYDRDLMRLAAKHSLLPRAAIQLWKEKMPELRHIP